MYCLDPFLHGLLKFKVSSKDSFVKCPRPLEFINWIGSPTHFMRCWKDSFDIKYLFLWNKSWVKAYSLFFLSESKQQAGGMRSWRRKLKLSCRKEALREKIAKQTWKESHNNTSSLKYSTQTDHSWKVVFETTIYFCKITQLFWTQDSCQQ